jgi:hypothetical protein
LELIDADVAEASLPAQAQMHVRFEELRRARHQIVEIECAAAPRRKPGGVPVDDGPSRGRGLTAFDLPGRKLRVEFIDLGQVRCRRVAAGEGPTPLERR